jgi:SpoIID/LytB domain protein
MLSHPNRHPGEGFDFCDTTHCQFYRGESDLMLEAASPAVASAVDATRDESLSYHGYPVETYFTATCGGLTLTPTMVWGGSSRYPYSHVHCNWCRDSSHYAWTRSAGAKSIEAALAVSRGAEISTENDSDGFVRRVLIRQSGRQSWPHSTNGAELSMSADEFRRAVGRRLGWNIVLSPTFTVRRQGEQYVFRGKGFGSQIGLCLAGAVAQARAGRRYDEILQFYFPAATLEKKAKGKRQEAKVSGTSRRNASPRLCCPQDSTTDLSAAMLPALRKGFEGVKDSTTDLSAAMPPAVRKGSAFPGDPFLLIPAAAPPCPTYDRLPACRFSLNSLTHSRPFRENSFFPYPRVPQILLRPLREARATFPSRSVQLQNER